MYRTTDWSLNIGHISHANARPGVPLEQQFACGGQATRSAVPRANEIVCFRLDPSLEVLVVAPTMTDLNAPGGGADDYSKLPKGNLDITGQYFIWTSNAGGNRLDAFVVKVPSHLLVSGGGGRAGDTVAPVVSISAPAAGGTVSGAVVVSASVSDNVGVAGVQFKLDGVNLGPEVTAPPFSMSWSSTTAANGAHTLTAVARDAASNTATSSGVLVTVSNVTRQDVTWINLVNATVTGTTLRKTAGCNGCADSGGASKQTLRGNGALELTASETTSLRYVGLGTGTVGQQDQRHQVRLRLPTGWDRRDPRARDLPRGRSLHPRRRVAHRRRQWRRHVHEERRRRLHEQAPGAGGTARPRLALYHVGHRNAGDDRLAKVTWLRSAGPASSRVERAGGGERIEIDARVLAPRPCCSGCHRPAGSCPRAGPRSAPPRSEPGK